MAGLEAWEAKEYNAIEAKAISLYLKRMMIVVIIASVTLFILSKVLPRDDIQKKKTHIQHML